MKSLKLRLIEELRVQSIKFKLADPIIISSERGWPPTGLGTDAWRDKATPSAPGPVDARLQQSPHDTVEVLTPVGIIKGSS
jgi:hypothetical protein